MKTWKKTILHHAEIDIGPSNRNFECLTDCLDSSRMEEIYACARSSNQVDESKTPTHDEVITWTKLRARVYSYSVLCLGKMSEHSGTRGAKHGVQPWQKHHFLGQRVCEIDQQKREHIRRFLTASRKMKYFMQASYNITGQKNGANIWITFEQLILRTKPLQNNRNDTLHCIIFGTIHNKWREAL